jgi:LytR cell envelope-related transcriptional attenuator
MTDFVHDLEVELLAAARRRATGRRPLPRITWRPVVAVLAIAALAVAAFATLRPAEPREPSKPGAFVPLTPTPIQACDGTTPPQLPVTFRAIGGAPPNEVTKALAVLRRPYEPGDQLLAIAAPLDTWLPVGEYDPKAVRRASVPASYLVPTSDLRTKPHACGGGESRGPGVCLVMPGTFACFTLAEIREGRALARNGRTYVGIVPDGPTWVRINASLGALAVDNVFEQTANSEPPKLVFEHDTPRVAVLNATRTPRLAIRLASTLTRVFGRQASAGDASQRSETTIVFTRRQRDDLLASAIACYLGASATGDMNGANWLNVPDDVDFVVVLGERM